VTSPRQTDLDLEFVPRDAVVQTARDATTAVASLPDDKIDDLRLLVSEVVTNSVRHGDPAQKEWIRLRVESGEGHIRVEVHAPGDSIAFERSAKEGALRESGWGMYLLEQLSDRWGVSSADHDTCVWFELDQ